MLPIGLCHSPNWRLALAWRTRARTPFALACQPPRDSLGLFRMILFLLYCDYHDYYCYPVRLTQISARATNLLTSGQLLAMVTGCRRARHCGRANGHNAGDICKRLACRTRQGCNWSRMRAGASLRPINELVGVSMSPAR